VLLQLRLTSEETSKHLSADRKAELLQCDVRLLDEIKLQNKWLLAANSLKDRKRVKTVKSASTSSSAASSPNASPGGKVRRGSSAMHDEVSYCCSLSFSCFLLLGLAWLGLAWLGLLSHV
jgi:predicted AAA+ superfamily ATPase